MCSVNKNSKQKMPDCAQTNACSVSILGDKIFWGLFFIFLILALFLRFYQIEARPLHSDEGVNYLFLQDIKNKGIYPYSHENYHGPIYFWLSYFATVLVGESVLGLRLVSILSGALLMLLLVPLRKQAGDAFVLLAALFIAISPSMVFHSRYGIHEMFFLLAGEGLGLSLFLLLETRRVVYIYSAALSLALAICTKETFVVTLASLALPVLLISFGRVKENFKFLLKEEEHLTTASFMAAIVILFVYSSGLRDFKSVRELFLGIPQWVGRGTKSDPGHFKVFSYYLHQIIDVTEPYLTFAMGVAGVLLVLAVSLVPLYGWKGVLSQQRRWGIYLAAWMFSSLLIYSAIPYKTPWIVINITFPALLFLAWLVAQLIELGPKTVAAGAISCLLILFLGLKNTVYYNYNSFPMSDAAFFLPEKFLPYGPGNPYSYVHTAPGMLELVRDIEDYWKIKQNAKILVGTKGYWPMPYYLRAKKDQAGYFVPSNPGEQVNNYDIIIIDTSLKWDAPSSWRKKYLRLSDVTEANIFFKMQSQ